MAAGAISLGAVTVPAGVSDAAVSSVTTVGVASSHARPIPAAEFAPAGNPLSVLNRYVSYSPAGYRISAPSRVWQTIPAQTRSHFEAYLKGLNGYIRQGSLRMTLNGVAQVRTQTTSSLHAKARWSGKHGYIETHWYGLKVGLDAYATNKVEGGAWVGAGISALIAALGGGPYAAAVAAALTIAAGAVQVCQHSNGWTYLYFIDLPVYTWVCNPFG